MRLGHRILLSLLLLMAFAEFIIRGPVRVIERGAERTDFAGPYIGARAWVRGMNPYISRVFWLLWKQAGGTRMVEGEDIASSTSYPISCFVLVTPFTPLPWRPAKIAAMAATTALILLAIVALASGLRTSGKRGLYIGLAIAFAPLHTGIGTGNPAIPAIALLVLGVWASLQGRDVTAGVFLALAMSLKVLVVGFTGDVSPGVGAFAAGCSSGRYDGL